eukprot:CAMPEP_0180441590 /NCGR_PEP_ID=MMETSP1036_2-20121128/13705_1 /TAXON_ID=632150 /ORGANISM="Azadinium spinosum, Strain 3D9" /LENGTH=291 /DNA_ID=CAMNT_0022447811 /DNA_START=21 /DNA_END=897 /DNA_ORIENTATION=+
MSMVLFRMDQHEGLTYHIMENPRGLFFKGSTFFARTALAAGLQCCPEKSCLRKSQDRSATPSATPWRPPMGRECVVLNRAQPIWGVIEADCPAHLVARFVPTTSVPEGTVKDEHRASGHLKVGNLVVWSRFPAAVPHVAAWDEHCSAILFCEVIKRDERIADHGSVWVRHGPLEPAIVTVKALCRRAGEGAFSMATAQVEVVTQDGSHKSTQKWVNAYLIDGPCLRKDVLDVDAWWLLAVSLWWQEALTWLANGGSMKHSVHALADALQSLALQKPMDHGVALGVHLFHSL